MVAVLLLLVLLWLPLLYILLGFCSFLLQAFPNIKTFSFLGEAAIIRGRVDYLNFQAQRYFETAAAALRYTRHRKVLIITSCWVAASAGMMTMLMLLLLLVLPTSAIALLLLQLL